VHRRKSAPKTGQDPSTDFIAHNSTNVRLLTLARDLRRRKARERHQLFVAEGVRAVEELSRSALVVRGVLTAPQLDEAPRGGALAAQLAARGIATERVDHREFASAAETDSPQGILAIAEVPDRSLSALADRPKLRVLVLDAVQDPGNVGTIVRTAVALGADATVALPGTVDLWNAKVVRSGMGAHFHHLCLPVTWDDLDAFRRTASLELWAADATGESAFRLAAPARVAIVVGNEGAGLSPAARERADKLVAIPIAQPVDSLNVAVAAGILLHELSR
jgi:RNA methyltransferase, TrmH family